MGVLYLCGTKINQLVIFSKHYICTCIIYIFIPILPEDYLCLCLQRCHPNIFYREPGTLAPCTAVFACWYRSFGALYVLCCPVRVAGDVCAHFRGASSTIPRKSSVGSTSSKGSVRSGNVWRKSVTEQTKKEAFHKRSTSSASSKSYETGEDVAREMLSGPASPLPKEKPVSNAKRCFHPPC